MPSMYGSKCFPKYLNIKLKIWENNITFIGTPTRGVAWQVSLGWENPQQPIPLGCQIDETKRSVQWRCEGQKGKLQPIVVPCAWFTYVYLTYGLLTQFYLSAFKRDELASSSAHTCRVDQFVDFIGLLWCEHLCPKKPVFSDGGKGLPADVSCNPATFWDYVTILRFEMPMFIRVHQYFEGLNNQNLKGLLDGLLGFPSWPAQDADEPLLSPSVWPHW